MNLKLNKYTFEDDFVKLEIGYKDTSYTTIFDKIYYEKISKYRWRISHKRNKKYVCSGSQSKKNPTIYIHQLIIGKAPYGYEVDHIDGESLNNLKSNLRIIDKSLNKRLLRVKSNNRTSGIRGVSYCKSKGNNMTWKMDFTYEGFKLCSCNLKNIESAVFLRSLFEDHFNIKILKNNPLSEKYLKSEYIDKEHCYNKFKLGIERWRTKNESN